MSNKRFSSDRKPGWGWGENARRLHQTLNIAAREDEIGRMCLDDPDTPRWVHGLKLDKRKADWTFWTLKFIHERQIDGGIGFRDKYQQQW